MAGLRSKMELVLLLEACDDEGAEDFCRRLCGELQSASEPTAALDVLVHLKEALQDGSSPQAQELLDRCSLDLCAPLILCGGLGLECAEEAVGLLKVVATHSPPREVYTGIVEAVSLARQDYWGEGGCQVACSILDLLPELLKRIERKRESFAGPSLTFAMQLTQKMMESADEDDHLQYIAILEEFTETSTSMCWDTLKLCDLPQAVAHSLRPHLLMLLHLYLHFAARAFLGFDQHNERHGILEDVLKTVAAIIHKFELHWADVEKMGEEQEKHPTTEVGTRDKVMDASVCKKSIFWGALHSISIKHQLRLVSTARDAWEYALETCCEASDSPTIFMGLDLLKSALQDPQHRSEILAESTSHSSVSKLALALVEYMHGSNVGFIRIEAFECLKLLLGSMDEVSRWNTYQKLVRGPYPDISALIFQEFKSNVVSAKENGQSNSKFSGSSVVEFIAELLVQHASASSDDWQTVSVRADFLSSVLNLYRFLCSRVQRAANGAEDASVLSRKTVHVVGSCCNFLRQQIARGLEECDNGLDTPVEVVLGLQRLEEVVGIVQELIASS